MQRIQRTVDTIRHELWPLPVLGIALGVIIGLALPATDTLLPQAREAFASWAFGGSPAAARSILTTIAGSVVTVTTLTFSMTLVTLQLAASQYSPRLLRTFTGDSIVHATLAVFLGTFAYCLTVLPAVRDATEENGGFVPGMSVSFAYLLAIAVVVLLVVFLTHLTRIIRVESIVDDVAAEARDALRRAYRNTRPGRPSVGTNPAVSIPAFASGFVRDVDVDPLLDLATRRDWTIALTVSAGDFVTMHETVATVRHASSGQRLSAEEAAEAATCLNSAVVTGTERTTVKDPRFPLQQMVDMSTRALSPGVNDPTTSMHCLNYLGAVLTHVATMDIRDTVELDSSGTLRVLLPQPSFTDLATLILREALTFGREQYVIVERAFSLLREAALCDTAGRYSQEIAALVEDFATLIPLETFSPRDADRLRHVIAEAAAAAKTGHSQLATDFGG
ncbi:DUF2254 domain-containing protein [Zhihengliuella flava]|uniref:Membrane protein n=1 Tax=Zhihengliuella flava TaxID=1285193 RepID=A0A931GFK7_9MICC|nr:DUF2254 domain-containing protein [Zhihengliuella flava]MBG6084767.1 putative membrane protein [Zhihengliuella flava]